MKKVILNSLFFAALALMATVFTSCKSKKGSDVKLLETIEYADGKLTKFEYDNKNHVVKNLYLWDDKITIQVGDDEMLRNIGSYDEFAEYESVLKIVFSTNVVLKDFLYFEIGYNEEPYYSFLGKILYHTDQFLPEKSFVAAWHYSTIPIWGISWMEDKDTRRFFYLAENNQDPEEDNRGAVLLIEFSLFPAGAFDGVITAQVENGETLDSLISVFRVAQRDWFTDVRMEIPVSSVSYSDDDFRFTLPKTIDDEHLASVEKTFGGYLDFSITDRNAKYFSFHEIEGYDSNGNHVGNFRLIEPPVSVEFDDGIEYTVHFWYVDRDVVIEGWGEGMGYDLILKKGWNKVYVQCSMMTGNCASSTVPIECNVKWQFERIEN